MGDTVAVIFGKSQSVTLGTCASLYVVDLCIILNKMGFFDVLINSLFS